MGAPERQLNTEAASTSIHSLIKAKTKHKHIAVNHVA
jgi:hypothetical protein